MPYSRPTLTQIITNIRNDFHARIEDSRTFLRRSFFVVASFVFGGAVHLLYEFINYVKEQMFVNTADQENLDLHGTELGLQRDSGEKASGVVTASGTIGTAISAGSILVSSDNLRYRVTAAATIGAGGTVAVSIEADKVGSSYNQDSGTVLSFSPPIASVNSDASVDSDGLTGGVNLETVEDYRARVLQRKRFPPHGGIKNDYVTWALEVTGVTRAWAIPQYQGIGTIGLAFVQDGESDIFPDETKREEVKDYIQAHDDPVLGIEVGQPVTARHGLFIIVNEALTVNLAIGITPNTSAIQTAVTNKLTDLMNTNGGAEQNISIGDLYEAIMTTEGVVRARVDSPTQDQVATSAQVHVLGDITWSDY